MFIGRENELNTLNKLYNSDKFEFAVIYGRRRVGKTALINEFVKDKDNIFLQALKPMQNKTLITFQDALWNIIQVSLRVLPLIASRWRLNTFLNLPRPKGLCL